MKNQRGIADGWLYLIGLLAVVAALTGLVMAWNSYTASLDKRGYDRGVSETKSKYAERDNAALLAANKRIKELEDAARKAEKKHQDEMAKIETNRIKEVKRANEQRDRDIAAVVAGTIKLRDPGGTAAGADSGGGRSGPEAGAGSTQCDGKAGTELSPAASRFLLEFANEADNVARQLGSCQAVINADRATINGP